MGANDDREMLEVAKEECIRLENELKAEKAAAQGVAGILGLALIELGGTLTVSDETMTTWTGAGIIHSERDIEHRLTVIRLELPNTESEQGR